MSNTRVVWSDDKGDQRKAKPDKSGNAQVNESQLELLIRRLTSGKGRTVVEIKGLPNNKAWNKKLASELKKKLGVGGAFKSDFIEVHGEKLEEVKNYLQNRGIRFKQTGG